MEEALRQRAASAGYPLPDSLPDGEHSWTQKLCWDERRRRFGERAVVAGGMYHSVFIEGDGTLLTCGSATLDGGRPGLLGHGTSVEVIETPRAVPGLLGVRVRTIAAAEYHSLAVSEEGVGYSWGYGGLGRLGHGDETDVHSPRQVAYPFGVTAGSSAAVVASAAGAMGGLAALSLAAATQHHLEGSHASAGSGDGGGASGGARGGARGGGSGVRVVACAAANCHTLLLSSTGLVCSFGYGGSGRLGLGPAIDDTRQLSPKVMDGLVDAHVSVRAVAAGTYHSLLLAADGVLYSCGEGGLGQLGHGERVANVFTPKPISALRDANVRVVAIAAARLHSCCVDSDGVAYSWGDGLDGRLGHGDASPSFVPRRICGFGGQRVCAVSCVWDHTVALTDGGAVFSWGLGHCGQLGHGEGQEEKTISEPRQIGGVLQEVKIESVAAGHHHCFAVASDGRLFGWGLGRTTEEEKVDTLGLRLESNQYQPKMYERLRVSRPQLARAGAA